MVKFYAPKGFKIYKATKKKRSSESKTTFAIYFRKGKFKIPFPRTSTVQGTFKTVGLDKDKRGSYVEYKKV